MSSNSKKRRKHSLDSNIFNEKNDYFCKHCVELNESKEEVIVLTDNKLLSLYESVSNSCDERPQHRITQFVIHDKNGFFCSFDCGKIENGFDVYLCGFVEPIVFDSDSGDNDMNSSDSSHRFISQNNGIAAQLIGPLSEWWISGFDGGHEVIIGVESLYASYILSEPHSDYKLLFNKSLQKMFLTKVVIESVLKNPDSSYEELIDSIKERNEELNEELIQRFASFIVEQIKSFDEFGDEDEIKLFNTEAIQKLIYISGLSHNLSKKTTKLVSHIRPIARIDARRAANSDTLTTSTPLVRKFFDSLFKEVIENDANYGKQSFVSKQINKSLAKVVISEHLRINWIGNIVYEDKFARRTYYKSFKINERVFSLGDFATVKQNDDSLKLGRIMFMFNNSNKQKLCHFHYFCYGKDTILGETAPNSHVFMTSECNDIEINHIIDKKRVDLSNKSNSSQDSNDCDYVCNKMYFKSSGRFEDLPQEIFDQELKCMSCALFDIQESMKTPKLGEEIQNNETNLSSTLKYKNLIYKNHTYFVGDCALLSSNAFNLPHFDYEDLKQSESDEPYDESLYPERYRKSFTDYVKGSNNDSPKPYNIGLIKEIYKQIDDTLEETKIVVNIFYRPQNVFDNYEDYRICDINLLFWSNEEITISVDSLRGICQVIYSKESPVIDFFVEPKVFYCNQLYNNESKTFSALTQDIYNKFSIRETNENKSTNKLRILDLFSGCGGLAYGFEKIGIASKVWAIEKDPSAVNSFKANFPSAVVFEEDVNHFLDLLLKGIKVDKNGQSLPQKGEIDLILGGPPCQGFSGMNRFSSSQYSLFKNSLVVSFLSYVDFYRPKYLLFENVRNFALFKSSMILKLTLSCLIRMGYKCQFAILQAANYGLPQTRRRTVIIGASSGYKLPYFPEPTHVFSLRQCQLSVNIDDRKYIAINETCAQFRAINVDDAISDLPKLGDDYSIDKVRHYNERIACHYQKILRKNSDNNLSDHLCKELSALCRTRIENIPQSVGSDWRDLPNISDRLSDGTIVKRLVYLYDDIKNGKSRSGHFRGVCLCASGKPCNGSESRQENTLIPWCLVHTANRQYQWSGLYGRLWWRGYFATTVTNPEPISKQGRVLHPNQNRIISIRESARSQGFPDHFKLVGSVLDRYRQIGNAVPIPLSIALAREFNQILN